MFMQKDEFIAYMANPVGLNEKSLNNIHELLREYPYFQAAHLLLVKNLSNLNHLKFNNQLRLSAAYVGNRKLLFRLLSEASTIPVSPDSPVIDKPVHDEIQETKPIQTPVEKSEKKPEEKSIADIVLEQVKELKQSLDRPEIAEEVQNIETQQSSVLKPSKEDFVIDDKQDITEVEAHFEQLQNVSGATEDLLVIEEPEYPVEPSTDPETKDAPKSSVGEQEKKTTQKKTPLEKEINLHEIHSFSSWLSLFKDDEPVSLVNEKSKTSGNNKSNELIEVFISSQPRMKKSELTSEEGEIEDISKHSVLESEDFITETLAKIYVKQKKYDKAISFYEKLSLKYPEKVSYFAVQIEEIKKLLTGYNS